MPPAGTGIISGNKTGSDRKASKACEVSFLLCHYRFKSQGNSGMFTDLRIPHLFTEYARTDPRTHGGAYPHFRYHGPRWRNCRLITDSRASRSERYGRRRDL